MKGLLLFRHGRKMMISTPSAAAASADSLSCMQKRLFSQVASSTVLSMEKYIEKIKPELQPPVNNKLLFNGQLQVMFVGGPNQREDYHIEEGEELFFQIQGDMNVNIVENGKHKTVHIPEGHMFLLPSRIPHSPQRYANTIGLVFERKRSSDEYDGLRYYVPNSTEVLYEEYFHCTDLGIQLVPVIKRFFASEAYKTKIPAPGMPVANPPIKVDNGTRILQEPFNWQTFLSNALYDNLVAGKLGSNQLVEVLKGKEFTVQVAFSSFEGSISPQLFQSEECFVWQFQGNSDIISSTSQRSDDSTNKLVKGDIILLTTLNGKPDQVHLKQRNDGILVCISNRK